MIGTAKKCFVPVYRSSGNGDGSSVTRGETSVSVYRTSVHVDGWSVNGPELAAERSSLPYLFRDDPETWTDGPDLGTDGR
jgi:hypothetical protein